MEGRIDIQRPAILTVLLFLAIGMLAPLIASAEDIRSSPEGTVAMQNLLRIIENQQQRIDAQDERIAEQNKMMQQLIDEVRDLKAHIGQPVEPAEVAGEKAAPKPAAEKSFQTTGVADPEEWPGFYRVPGTNTRFKVSGYAELDIAHDTDPIGTPSAFVTSAIVTRNEEEAKGADGQTNFSIQASRLAIETRTPLSGSNRVTTFISADLFNDFGSTTPEFRLRQAYGEVTDFLHLGGDLLLGQDWTTFTNLYAIPGTLDFEGPNAIFGVRHPMVRWTVPFENGLKLKLAAEAPDKRNFSGADSESRWPDGVVALGWERAPFNLLGSFLVRDLRASAVGGEIASELGWGVSFQGRINMPEAVKDDFLQVSLTYGEGIGGVMNDGPPDAVYNPAINQLELVDTVGWFVGYQHWWNPNYYSLATYGNLEQDNLDIQAPTAFKKTQYSSIDLVWTPDPRWLLGLELLYGTREDNDSASGSVFRTLVTSRFNF